MVTLSRIAPEVPVSKIQESIEYYREKLGFQVVMEMPGGDYAIVERGGIAIHLFHDNSRNHSPVGMHIFTHELDELYDELTKRGARVTQDIEQKPWGNRDFRVNDPSGNQIKFTEPLSKD
jgi:uncharacterized glyoxalase superfamily protein PhnB